MSDTEEPTVSSDTLTVQDLIADEPRAEHEASDTAPAAVEAEETPTAPEPTAAKPTISTKTNTTKPNGSTTTGTPLVKRILNSGTFGSGAIKPTGAKPPTTTAPGKAAPTVAVTKRLNSSTTKSMTTPKPPTSASTVPSRRASVVPSSKPSLASSTASKPPATTTVRAKAPSPATNGPAKPPAATRPRASVSSEVKRAPLSARPSVSSAKPPPSGTTRPTRTTTSISSIKEIREDGKALEELQSKLKEATDAVTAKTENVANLESEVESLKSSLANALAEVEAKVAAAGALEQENQSSAEQLQNLKASSEKLQSEYDDSTSELAAIREQLEVAKVASIAHNELVQSLQAQIQVLETEVTTAKGNVDTLRSSLDGASSEASTVASIEHEALLKAQTDFAAIQEETAALKVAHEEALAAATQKIQDLHVQASRAEAVETELSQLKTEREETATKVSELEIEILELKESQDAAEDERRQTLEKLRLLQEELSAASTAIQIARDNTQVKVEEHAHELEDIALTHKKEIEALTGEQSKLTAELDALKQQLSDSQVSHQQSELDASASSADYEEKLREAEQKYLTKEGELLEEIKRITVELESQEAQYNTKVQAVKEEHAQLLQEAFERAKNEAADAHGQDLQTLNTNTQATLEQVKKGHQVALDDLIARHASELASQVHDLEKEIGRQAQDLKATQDDLSKAKAALESARADVESLTSQRDEARASLSAGPTESPEQMEELNRVKQDLARAQDDFAAQAELLSLMKSSLTEMTHHHQAELEEAGRARVEELTKIRAVHDDELSSLAKQKADIAMRLDDTEGELQTLKATLAAEPVVSKTNGNGNASPPPSGVSKEELERLHAAHNLRIGDLEAEHSKALKALQAEVEESYAKASRLEADLARKAMELQYTEQEQDENTEEITRLKEELEAMTAIVKGTQATAAGNE